MFTNIAMNFYHSCYQKELLLLSLLKSAHGKFAEISIETFIKAFLVLEFSLLSEL